MTQCQSLDDARPLVAFDFDGTLTVRDSFNAFLLWRRGSLRALAPALRLIPAAVVYLFQRDRGRLKSAMVHAFLGGVALDTAGREAEQFARSQFLALLRPDALARWREWQDQGACLAIVTASPEFLVAPFAKRLGADHLIATRFGIDGQGCFTGALDGGNCRGPEKVARLKALFGANLNIQAAYGDTSGDREMLAAARERGYRVFKGHP
jgi:phosphatidylglycerophosphatase C